MTRIEENGLVVDKMVELARKNKTGTYEEMVTFQLGVIASMLTDISKSLAALANKVEIQEE